ncbi:FMN reductase [Schumannella sp. 10F1B-5-1]|uniref:FMN reductase n=1 Tax=Schumannella sp. 10F1B-5-1 TaxID=2590780 RepID=UPI0011301590|nr:FMN reductase [Schumannella sp. 10F1B-5-1]TPW71488.1 FMN reductase [Schumannella sp. 10F1B-5-1]
MSRLKIVAVSGSPTAPSRTTALVDDVARSLAEQVDGEAQLIELAPLLGQLAQGVWRTELGAAAQAALDEVEQADVLVVGSPAYRASYTGLFKLFFDHIGQYALVDKPILLTATGGSDRHALLVEHQMRPLFGFFQSHTLPLGIFASEGDFENYRVTSDDLRARIDLSIRRALPFIRASAADRDALAVGARPDAF